jgi:hypothetical protein
MNSASLRFIPAERLEAEGYGQYAKLFAKSEPAPKGRPGGGTGAAGDRKDEDPR